MVTNLRFLGNDVQRTDPLRQRSDISLFTVFLEFGNKEIVNQEHHDDGVIMTVPTVTTPTIYRTDEDGWWTSLIMWGSIRRNSGSSTVIDVLELQPLHEQEHHHQQQQGSDANLPTTLQQLPLPPTAATVAAALKRGEYRTLESVLGVDEPISLGRCNSSSIFDESTTVTSSSSSSTAVATKAATALSYLEDYFYPSDIPISIQLWRYSNICIPISYLAVGMMQGMLRPLLNVYPIDLGATESQQTVIASIAILPSTLKILYGFISDNIPIYGYRRKPYMLLGWILTVGSMIILLLYTDLSIPPSSLLTGSGSVVSDDVSDTAIHSQHQLHGTFYQTRNDLPSMEWLMVTFFISGSGMWIADVMADAFVAQKVRYEPEHARGQIQSTCYALRFFGIAAFAPVSTYLYNRGLFGYTGPATIVTILSITPLITAFPLWFVLEEERYVPVPSTKNQCYEIWKTVCSRAVWQPMGFVYLYNLLQIPNAAWRQYLKSVLSFTSNQLNVLLTVSYILLYLGTVVHKYFFLTTSWRRIYYFGFMLNAIASLGQLALIRGYTFGIHPFYLALGDDAIIEFIVGIQMLPICILMVSLCPPNSEGASYAMFTTAWNSAMLLAQAIGSSILLGIWDTSKETMLAGNLDGLFNLSVLTTFLQMLPIVFVWWLPHGRAELEKMSNDGRTDSVSGSSTGSSSRIGGGIFLFVVFSSVLYTIIVTLLNVLVPGWI